MKEQEVTEILDKMTEKYHIEDNKSSPVEGAGGVSSWSMNTTLEEAANLLLSLLSPSIKDYVFEVADLVLKVPRWQLLLGALISQNQNATLTSAYIDPSWQQMEILVGPSTCQECGKQFSPKKFGEKFCSPDCGNTARRKVIEEHKERMKERAFI